MYLIDTNVISEMRKGAGAHPGVVAFFGALDTDQLYLAVQTVGELRGGLERIRQRGDAAQAQRLQDWLDILLADYESHVLDFDIDCAQIWSRLMAPGPQNPVDKQIAAIALIHDLCVVTRNIRDFDATGVRLLNPWEQRAE